MRLSPVFISFVTLVLALLGSFVFWPELDLAASAFFANGAEGFVLRDQWLLTALVKVVFYGARVIGLGLLLAIFVSALRGNKDFSKRFCFLLLCLLIGPGLIANVVLKDNWGRARPREIVAFGGDKRFTPAFYISDQCKRNCSFVSGDASFGFFLTCFAYVAAPRRRRLVFWGAVGAGSVFAGARLLLGAHFLSDILTAIALVMSVNAGLHMLFYGRGATKAFWSCLIRGARQ